MREKRTFEHSEAKRSRVPLLIGMVGPSGSGKTYSALRVAAGIQRVVGGKIFGIDTEARRMLHYAKQRRPDGGVFEFEHTPFAPPFAPLDYLDGIEYCVSKGASVVVIDSMSHEHEGPGGVLEMHAAEVQRMSGGDAKKAERVKMLAWGKPKAERRRMINSIIQMPVSVICCFRAKEKLKIQSGKEPEPLGFMAIAGEELIYEMTLNCLLYPNSKGQPTWRSDFVGERMQMKLPEQFRALFADSPQLSEDLGESLAKWAEGGEVTAYGKLIEAIAASASTEELEKLIPSFDEAKKKRTVNPAEFSALRSAWAARRAELNPPKSEPKNEAPANGASETNEAGQQSLPAAEG